MLGKLFKHEFRATSRVFLPMYGLLIVFSLVNEFIATQRGAGMAFSGLLLVIPVILYVSIIVAIVAMTITMLIQRFYKNLLGDEGYLSHTLPVKPWQHILCKAVTATFWSLMSSAMVTLSVLYMAIDVNAWGRAWDTFVELMEELSVLLHTDALTALASALLLGFVSVIEKILLVYAGMSIGQISSKHKAAMSVLAIIAMQICEQVLNLIVMRQLSLWTNIHIVDNMILDMTAFFAWYLGSAVVFGIVYSVITNHMLKRHLNLA